jgi:PAS domain S-box-containing protein
MSTKNKLTFRTKEYLRVLFEYAPDAHFLTDLKGNLIDVNKAAEKITDYSKKELIGKNFVGLNLFPKDQLPLVLKRMKKVISKKSEEVNEYTFIQKNGNQILIEARSFPVKIEGENFILANIRDITDRKKAEEKIKREKEFAENAINSQMDTFFVFNPKTGKPIVWNKNFTKISEYTNKEIAAMKAPESWYSKEDLKKAASTTKEVIKKGYAMLEMDFISKSGKKIPFEYKASLIKGEKGEDLLVSIGRDITDRKKAEEKLQKSEKQYRDLFNSTREGFALCKVICNKKGKPIDYRFIKINPAFGKQSGMNVKTSIGKTIKEIYPDIEQKWIDRYGKVAITRKPIHFTDYNHNTKRYYNASAFSPSKNHFAMIFRDITEKKKAEEALKENKNFLQNIYDGLNSAIFVVDVTKDGDFVYSGNNIYHQRAMGMKPGEIVGKKPEDLGALIPPEMISKVRLNYSRCLDKGKQIEYMEKLEIGGKDLYVETTLIPLKDSTGSIFRIIGLSTDITEKKKAGEALRESEEKFRNLAEHSPNMIFINQKGKVVYANKKCEEMGYKRKEFYSPKFNFLSTIAPESIELVKQKYRKHLKGKDVAPYEYILIKKNGKKIPVLISTKLINYQGEKAILGIVTDITKQKESEKSIKELNQLQQRFIDDASHELRTPLAILQANLDLMSALSHDCFNNKEATKIIENSKNQIKHLSTIMEEISLLGRGKEIKSTKKKINLETLIRKTAQELKSLAEPKEMNCEIKILNKNLQITGDRQMIQKLIRNLISNAIKYGRQKGKIKISLKKQGQWAETEVKDDGAGIAKKDLPYIFDRFYQSKKKKYRKIKGAGLGLAICKKIIELHGGKIEAKSKYGKGSTFKVLLPLRGGGKIA